MTSLFRITIEGKDWTLEVQSRLLELSITDKAGNEADELSLTLSDDTEPYLPLPEKGNTIRVWLADPFDSYQLVDKGSYTIDEAEHSGAPDQMSIKAKSADMKSELKTKRSESHHRTTLGDIARKIAGRHQLEAVIAPDVAGIAISHIDQTRESDMNLLSRLADDHDLLFTVKAGKLLLKSKADRKTASGQTMQTVLITRQSGDSHRYSRADRDTDHDSAAVQYHDKADGKVKTVEADQPKDGKAPVAKAAAKPKGKAKISSKPAKSEAEAKARSTATAKRTERAKAEFTLTLAQAHPAIVADSPIQVQGFRPYIDDKQWVVAEITHRLSGSGYQSEVKLNATL